MRRYREQVDGYTTREGEGAWGQVKRVKGVNCMVMDHNKTCRAKHSMVYTDVEL